MAEFGPAVAHVLSNEGRYVNDASDPGGATNHGISLRFLRRLGSLLLGDIDHDGDIDTDDIKKMQPADAKKIYRSQWWDRYRYDEFTQRIATKIFDTAVNLGPSVAHKLAQAALNELGMAVAVDGKLGPITRAALGRVQEGRFVRAYCQLQAEHYRHLVTLNPAFSRFIRGWLARAAEG